ncbi:GNAT family N-acetyltransferase [Streptomyces sp. NPDC087440]|uniref:GNAT family N-acetyltransferase n=1 Tax=Streptomyces sp. NPDC087440 TaxID=3365790 RepID=UPI003812905D
MTWTFTEDLKEFLDVARASLASGPVRNTLLLTVSTTLARRGVDAYGEEPPLFGWWRRPADGIVDGALIWTPPEPVLLGAVPPEAVRPLVRALGDHSVLGGRKVVGLNVEGGAAAEAAAAWAESAGAGRGGLRRGVEHRLYRLGELIPPPRLPAGRARLATPEDREVLVEWVRAFAADTGQPGDRAGAIVDERVRHGGLTVWEDPEGIPVSMAGVTLPAEGMVRLALVYTPPELRGSGYAAAVTADVGAAAVAAGVGEVLLFADAANPVSNRIYQRLGFEEVSTRVVLTVPAGE